jgi:hypothetical protein
VTFFLLAFAFGLRLVWFGLEGRTPPVLQNLPDSNSEADQQAFIARLHRDFPAGTEAAALVKALSAQGFKVSADRVATYDQRAGMNDKCRRSANIRWSVDAEGRVSEVGGGYLQHCPI